MDADRPKSPSWVPSYSVSSQGNSPLHSPNVQAVELPAESAPMSAGEPEPQAVPSEEPAQPEPEPVVETLANISSAVVVESAPEVTAELVEESAEQPSVTIEVTDATEVPAVATVEAVVPEVRSS